MVRRLESSGKMTPFYDVSSTAQFCRLRGMAVQALAAYELGDVSVEPLQYSQKATFRVRRLAGGGQFVLSVHPPRPHGAASLRSEMGG
jgi:hypothetical protein